MNIAQSQEAVRAASELLSAKVDKDGKQIPLLGYKKITLAHSLGKVIDSYQSAIKRTDESRQKLLEELGDKAVAFSSEEELQFGLYQGVLDEEQQKAHEGRTLYQTTKVEFDKLEKEKVKVIRDDLYSFTIENGTKFRQAEFELMNQPVEVSVHIPIEDMGDIDFTDLVINEKSLLKSENDAVTLILMLHEIVEG